MSFITVAGETQLAVKQGAGQPLNITHFVLANITGLGAEPANRIEAMPAAGDIVADLAVTKNGYVNGNQVVYSLTMDSTVGDFDFNWVGLKDDENVLIAVAYIPTTSKTKTVGNVPGNNMTRNFLLAFSGITATTAISVSAETWQIDFTARLLGIDERERLSNLDIYDAAAFFGSGWQVVRQGSTSTYDVLAGIGYVGGIRINNTATQTVAVASPPKSVWLDVSLEGDISDVTAVVSIIADAAEHPNYTDGNGFDHYLTKIADIAANGDVTDLRIEADHEAKIDPHSQYLTHAEGDAAYDPKGGLAAHTLAGDPHSQYLKEADAVSETDAKAGVATTVKAWSALRVKQAIQALVQAATETVAGIVERATQAEVDAGTDDTRYVSPKKLKGGFTVLMADNGYIVCPTWMGGFMLQWLRPSLSSSPSTFNWVLPFPNSARSCLATDAGSGEVYGLRSDSLTNQSVTISGSGNAGIFYVWAIGH